MSAPTTEQLASAREVIANGSERDLLIEIKKALNADGYQGFAQWIIEQSIARVYFHGELV